MFAEVVNAPFTITTKNNVQLQKRRKKAIGRGAIILIGPSGCGKGEMAKVLMKEMSIKPENHLSMGDMLREAINKPEQLEQVYIRRAVSIFHECNSPEIINKAKEHEKNVLSKLKLATNTISQYHWLKYCVENGLLLPDVWTARIINRSFENMLHLQNESFILDGYPRTANAVDSLLDTFKRMNLSVSSVVHLDISRFQMKARLNERKRQDDLDQDALDNRYEFYVSQVIPAINRLKERLGDNKVHKVNAHQPVFEDGKLNKKASINTVAESMLRALKMSRAIG